MSRVITFSRNFPATHPRAGEPTHFVEKITTSLFSRDDEQFSYEGMLAENNKALWGDENGRELIFDLFFRLDWNKDWHPKGHTIRAGKRWKVGDKFSPRVWSGKPYASKQITIAPDIEIVKLWDLHVKLFATSVACMDKGNADFRLYLQPTTTKSVFPRFIDYAKVAVNDGLTADDFFDWFLPPLRKAPTLPVESWYEKTIECQILCWNPEIEY